MMKMVAARLEKMDASHKEMVAEIKPERDVETMACQETTEVRIEEEKLTSVDRKPEVAEQREVPVEDAEVMAVGEPKKKRRTDRKLAA
jgi:peroxiredoxin family protein